MIVVDASALVEVLLDTAAGQAISQRLPFTSDGLHAPHLLDIEVTHAIRRLVAIRLIDADRGRAALEDLAVLPLIRHRHCDLLAQIWQLRNTLSAYDAIYVVLAAVLDATLLTRDGRLASVARRFARVERV